MIVSVVVALLSPVSQVIFHQMINPGFFSAMIQYAVDHGEATLENAQAFFNLQSYIIQSVIAALVMGTITSLAVAAFHRTRTTATPVRV